ncbi:MAG TPA: hypothetical protein PLL33_05095 [Paracoccus sp. (in: a-proteobacteria)]|nr:hypothetical protein [Paracoccus sp. (in: a-proteobacteria)]
MNRCLLAFMLCPGLLPLAAHAETTLRRNGTDTFVADPSLPLDTEAPGDLFVVGNGVTLRGLTRGNAHMAGFNLDIAAPVEGDLYAAGANVELNAPVGKNATVAGWSVRLREAGTVVGNARLAGGTVTLEAPVAGALTMAGSEVTINAAVKGDAWVMAEKLVFGPKARIDGRLVYSTIAPIAVPAAVISQDRVSFEPSAMPDAMHGARRGWEEGRWPSWPAALSFLSGGLIGVAFLLLVGGLFLGLAPRLIETTQTLATARPGRNLLLGAGGLSLLFGLVPVLAITLIGIPLVPIALLLAAVGWVLGYLLGVYAVMRRLVGNLGGRSHAPISASAPAEPVHPLLSRILALAVGLLLAALLNFVPVLGWMANIALVLLGLGAIAERSLNRLTGRPGPTAPAG